MVVTRPRTHTKDYRALHQGGSPRQRSSAGTPLRSLQSQSSNASRSVKKPTSSSAAAHDEPHSPPSAETSEDEDPDDLSYPSPSHARPRSADKVKTQKAASGSRIRRSGPLAFQQSLSSNQPAAPDATRRHPPGIAQTRAGTSAAAARSIVPAGSTLAAASSASASTASNNGGYDEAAARTAMLQSLAPLSLAPRAIAPPTGNLSYHQRIRKYFTELKNSFIYQLNPRSSCAPAWKDVAALRRKEESLVKRDALLPSKPLNMLKLEEATISAANINASSYTLDSISAGRIFGLPFADSFEKAPILGIDDVNLIVRSSTGETLLQRFSATNLHEAYAMKNEWEKEGRNLLKALFARGRPAQGENRAEGLPCGGWYEQEQGRYGWTEEHMQRRPESDKALHWAWKYFHAHVTTLACFLEKDFQEEVRSRETGFERWRRMLGEEQTGLAHSWWSRALFTKGHAQVEQHDASAKEPSILFCFEEPLLLYVAHCEGFFKVILRPGQAIFFRSSQLHQLHPLTQPRDNLPHYSVRLAMHKGIANLDCPSRMPPRRLEDPPQPAPGDKIPRLSYAGIGHGRSAKG